MDACMRAALRVRVRQACWQYHGRHTQANTLSSHMHQQSAANTCSGIRHDVKRHCRLIRVHLRMHARQSNTFVQHPASAPERARPTLRVPNHAPSRSALLKHAKHQGSQTLRSDLNIDSIHCRPHCYVFVRAPAAMWRPCSWECCSTLHCPISQ